jgi:hypothetical protein
MTYDEIKAALAGLVADMMAKHVKKPNAKLTIDPDGSDHICLWCDIDARQFGGEYMHFIHGDTTADVIANAHAYIAGLPAPETEGERKFTRALAVAVDIATEYALPDAMVAPVRTAIREVNAVLIAGPKANEAAE